MEIGKNAEENSKLVADAAPNHLWFHLDSGPSPHVILREDPDKENIMEAALLCKSRSKMKNLRKVKVIYCEVRNLKRGSKPGEVIIRQRKRCKTVVI